MGATDKRRWLLRKGSMLGLEKRLRREQVHKKESGERRSCWFCS